MATEQAPGIRSVGLSLDEKLVSTACAAVESTFSQFLGIRPNKVDAKWNPGLEIPGDLSGIITMREDAPKATMVLSFPKGTILPLMNKIYMTELTEVDDNVRAGVGEFANVIYGLVKSPLNATGRAFKLQLPEVIATDKYAALQGLSGKSVQITFQIPEGTFWLAFAEIKIG